MFVGCFIELSFVKEILKFSFKRRPEILSLAQFFWSLYVVYFVVNNNINTNIKMVLSIIFKGQTI